LHGCFVSQYGWLALSWYLPVGQSSQLAEFAVAEKLPAAQATHRSGLELVESASYVPGLHGCFVSQYGTPVPSWNLPLGHSVQFGMFGISENCSLAQLWQVRSAMLLPLLRMLLPAVHWRWGVQAVAAWPEYWPLGQVSQFFLLRFGWKVPAAQGWQMTEATSLQNVGSAVSASSVVWNSVSPKSVSQYHTLLDEPTVVLILNPCEQPPWHSVSSVVLAPLQPTLTSPSGQRASHMSQLAWPVVFWYLPPGQLVHAVASVKLENEPAVQLEHNTSPCAGENLPAGHVPHVGNSTVAPYLPPGQLVHALAPAEENEPAAQIVAHPALSFVCATRSPLLAARPCGQDMQDAPPNVLLLNFPAGQSVHARADTNLPAAQHGAARPHASGAHAGGALHGLNDAA
jgi:hypothetical protein